MKNKFYKIITAMFALSILLVSCEHENESEFTELHGVIQKGPFVSGSSVTIKEIIGNPLYTRSHTTKTADDYGSYNLSAELYSDVVEITAKGKYFREDTGNLSSSEVELKAVAPVTDDGIINVNVLTTFTYERIKYLTEYNGYSFEEAKSTAEKEVLEIFGIIEPDICGFEKMDISKEGKDNAILLAISVIMSEYNSFSWLGEEISADIYSDGNIDDESVKESIISLMRTLELRVIRENLEQKYLDSGLDYTIPDFERYSKCLLELEILDALPQLGYQDAIPSSTVIAFTNQELDPSTVNTSNVQLFSKDTSGSLSQVAGQVSYNDEERLIFFTPDSLLLSATNYVFKISTELRSISGNRLGTEFTSEFRTITIDTELGLIAKYMFNEADSDSVLFDSSGNSNNGKPNSLTFTEDRHGKTNESGFFSSTGTYVELPAFLELPKNEWTLSVWFKLDVYPASGSGKIIFGTSYSGGSYMDIPLYCTSDYGIYSYADGNRPYYKPILLDTWYHILLIHQNDSVYFYLNGEKVVSDTYHIYEPYNGKFYLGCLNPTNTFAGSMDDVRIYDRVLNEYEIELLSK